LRRQRGIIVDLDGALGEAPEALAQAISGDVGPIGIKDAPRLTVLGRGRKPAFSEQTERFIVDNALSYPGRLPLLSIIA
jgi:hypothetical protein